MAIAATKGSSAGTASRRPPRTSAASTVQEALPLNPAPTFGPTRTATEEVSRALRAGVVDMQLALEAATWIPMRTDRAEPRRTYRERAAEANKITHAMVAFCPPCVCCLRSGLSFHLLLPQPEAQACSKSYDCVWVVAATEAAWAGT